MVVIVSLLTLLCAGGFGVLVVGLGVGYFLLSRRKGKKLKEIKPKEALTAAFQITRGGLKALDDDDDDDDDFTPAPPPPRRKVAEDEPTPRPAPTSPPPSPPPAPSPGGSSNRWGIPEAYLEGNYTWEQADELDYEDIDDPDAYPTWRAKRRNMEVGAYQELHVPWLHTMTNGESRRLFAVYGVPVGWGSNDNDRAEYAERFKQIDAARDTEDDWEAYLRDTWGMLNEEHHDFIRGRLFPGWEQQEMMDQMLAQRHAEMSQAMQDNIAAREASGELDPVEGVSLEQWAAAQAAISQGGSAEEQCNALGVDMPAWDRISAEWNARMSRDTTATIATVYGNAFAGAGQGQFGASSSALANSHVQMGQAPASEAPFPMARWIEVQEAMNAATARGEDPNAVLAGFGMNAGEWGPAAGWWGMKLASEPQTYMHDYNRLTEKYREKYATEDPDGDLEL